MKKLDMKLKIKEGLKTEAIIKIFETESPIVKLIETLKSYANKIVIIGIIYIVAIILLQRYFYLMGIGVSLLFSFVMVVVVCKKVDKISYDCSKNIGGKKAKGVFRRKEGTLNTMAYNFRLMKKEEWRLINKILDVNCLKNRECIKELKEYYAKNRTQEKQGTKAFLGKFLGIYLIPIIAIVISIYTTIFNSSNIEQNVINISYIILSAVIIVLIAMPIYWIHYIRKLSVTNIYTLHRLEKLLIELLLKEEQVENLKFVNSKNDLKN